MADLRTFGDRAITLVMLLGGLRAAEVRSLRLADVDMGLRRVRVTGKGGKERVVRAENQELVLGGQVADAGVGAGPLGGGESGGVGLGGDLGGGPGAVPG